MLTQNASTCTEWERTVFIVLRTLNSDWLDSTHPSLKVASLISFVVLKEAHSYTW